MEYHIIRSNPCQTKLSSKDFNVFLNLDLIQLPGLLQQNKLHVMNSLFQTLHPVPHRTVNNNSHRQSHSILSSCGVEEKGHGKGDIPYCYCHYS